MKMNRLQGGFIAGGAGLVLLIVSAYVGALQFFGPLLAIIVGIGAGILVAGNPTFRGKAGGAGAIAGLLAGGLLFVAQIAAGQLWVNRADVQSTLVQVQQTVGPQLTATAQANGTTTSVGQPSITQAAGPGIGILSGCLGLIGLGLSTGAGAATGAIAGRKNRDADVPMDANYPTFATPPQANTPPTGYPPPQSPYGAQQQGTGYPPPEPPAQQ